VRSGLEEAAQRQGFRLNIFVGHELDTGPEAVIHRFAGRENAAGMVVLSASLAAKHGLECVQELIDSHSGLPVCSLGVALPGVPSVVADNRPGLQEVIDHLIIDHGRRRLACLAGLRGNPDHDARLIVYREALTRHNIPFDPSRVVENIGNTPSARIAVQQLIDHGVQFDAIVAVDDPAALGALEVLNNAGLQVPQQVSLTGFDDLPVCRFTQPPLTTVRQPIRAMAAKAIELVAAQMAGDSVPLLTSLSVESVRRVSCGCLAAFAPAYPQPSGENAQNLPYWLVDNEQSLADLICTKLRFTTNEGRNWVLALLGALGQELAGQRGAFIAMLEERMRRAEDPESQYESLQRTVAVLRGALPAEARHLDTLWADAERSLAVATMVDQARQRVEIETSYASLLVSGASLTRAFDWDSLKQTLAEVLPPFAESAFISLKVNDSTDWLAPFFCFSNGAVYESQAGQFPARQLIPPDVRATPRQCSRLILPLTVEQEYLGVAVVELRPGLGIHEMLRSQISTALKSVALHQQIVQKTALHERSVQERLATSKRLQSLSVLAGGVAHDLNNALGPLVALPNIILDQLKDVPMGSGEATIVADLELLEGASLRAAQTIKDLLTLGRQGRMPKGPMDLNRFIASAVESDQLLREFASRRGVSLGSVLSGEKLVISASEAQLHRAVSNLLRNAIDATPPGGRVQLKLYTVRLTEALEVYETIEPGEYAVIEVTDTGCGIDSVDLGRVFEPFYSKKQLSESSGSGLGLAIVHGVVKEHDGFASVESTRGRGTTFTLYFPLVATRAPSVRAIPLVRAGTGRILVVDDDWVQLRTAARVLSHYGYEVTTAATSAEAHRAHEAATAKDGNPRFDLVVLDMILHEADDGLALFARLQRLGLATKGIIVSGNAPTGRLSHAISKGLRFLAKPYRADELIASIQAAIAAPAPEPITMAPDGTHLSTPAERG
jgi:DNA-binding LacI/PurR family transcriptional regulator/signal transduction histidine kinase/ActR/RegA family two-component response regulator